MKPRKLSNRIMFAYAAMFFAVFLLLGAAVVWTTWNSLVTDKREYIVNVAAVVSSHVIEEYYEGDDISDAEILRENTFDLNLNLILYDTNGDVISRARNFLMEESELPASAAPTVIRTERGGLMLCCSSPVEEDELRLGKLTAVLNLNGELSYVTTLAVELLLASVAGVLLAAFVGVLVSKRLLKPISDMVVEADSIDTKSMEKRLAVPKAEDELKMLANTLNRMLERVQRAYDDQARFSSDASHELRTPITVISGYVDMLDRWGKNDPAVLDEAIANIKKQASYMQKLTDELLLIARKEVALTRENIDMEELVKDVFEQFKLACPARVFINECKGSVLFADRLMVSEILYALLDNACKYTDDNGVISVGADKDGLFVTDDGVGMDEEQKERAFDRFYRADKARSREKGGHGLGLSIVMELCRLHGGTAEITVKEGEGTTVRCRLTDSPR